MSRSAQSNIFQYLEIAKYYVANLSPWIFNNITGANNITVFCFPIPWFTKNMSIHDAEGLP